jgi:hypothetical protein
LYLTNSERLDLVMAVAVCGAVTTYSRLGKGKGNSVYNTKLLIVIIPMTTEEYQLLRQQRYYD